MTVQLSVAVRNARLDTIETTIGASAILKIRTGAQPANCAAADSGTVLATLNLPADWMAAAAAGSKAKSGTWEDLLGDADGNAGHWRLYASDGTTCHAQGTATATGGGGDLTLDNISIATGQAVTVTAWTFTDGNAQVATGTATLDFGATPTDEATILVSGLSGLTVATHKEAFVQGDDSTVDNDANAHQFLGVSGRFTCEYVSATSMNVLCHLIMGLATGTFTIHYATVPA